MAKMRSDVEATSDSYPYVTGMGFRNRAHLIFDEFQKDSFANISEDGQVVFIKTDFIRIFFMYVIPRIEYNVKIVTHNSALGVGEEYRKFLDHPRVISWYAQNANIEHPKLRSIPLGLANKRWEHGDVDEFESVLQASIGREHLVYMNFNIQTSPDERSEVFDMFSKKDFVHSAPERPFRDYLHDLRGSKFSLSPQGRGVDCHRVWESILMGTIPIVKNCRNISFYKDMPILIVDKWDDVSKDFLNEEYAKISKSCTNSKLFLDYWIDELGLLGVKEQTGDKR